MKIEFTERGLDLLYSLVEETFNEHPAELLKIVRILEGDAGVDELLNQLTEARRRRESKAARHV